MPQLHSLSTTNRPARKRVGRGIAAGRGKTAGRGTKGQKSRSGYNIPRRFEGGQTSLIQRLPKKRGFKHSSEKPIAINANLINKRFGKGETVTPQTLIEKGLIKSIPAAGIKIIGSYNNTKDLKFQDVSFSASFASHLPKDEPSEKKASPKK